MKTVTIPSLFAEISLTMVLELSKHFYKTSYGTWFIVMMTSIQHLTYFKKVSSSFLIFQIERIKIKLVAKPKLTPILHEIRNLMAMYTSLAKFDDSSKNISKQITLFYRQKLENQKSDDVQDKINSSSNRTKTLWQIIDDILDQSGN